MNPSSSGQSSAGALFRDSPQFRALGSSSSCLPGNAFYCLLLCVCLTSFTLEALGFDNYCPAANSAGKWVSHSVRLCHISGVSLGHAVVGGWHRHSTAFPAAHNWLWRTASEKGVVYGMLFSISLSLVICPLAFNELPWQWLIKKVNFHLELSGIRQSSAFLMQGDFHTRRSSEQAFPLCLFSLLRALLNSTQVLGPKDYKVQKNNPNQTKRP